MEDGEYYIADIIGSKVITDEDKILGTLTDVLQTGANDVYVVKTKDGKEYYYHPLKNVYLIEI